MKIDGKFSTDGARIFNTVSGEAIPEDEPLFLLRARDGYAFVAISEYEEACKGECNELHMAGIHQVSEKFRQFAIDHPERMKQPGITRHLVLDQARAAEQGQEPDCLCCGHSYSDHLGTVPVGSDATPCIRCSCVEYHKNPQPTQPPAGDVQMASCIHGKKWDEACYEDSCYRSTTPPAANVVERMCSDYGNLTGTDPDPVAMAAALAVAREGYVSLEDVEKKSIALIAKERERQIKGEGWTLSHDDAHKYGELAAAASCYAHHANCQARKFQPSYVAGRPSDWPWDAKWWKPSVYPVRNLAKAGALIAAEIDRLARLAKPAEQTDEQKVEAILKHIWNAPVKYSDHLLREIAAEIVAALRDGKEGK